MNDPNDNLHWEVCSFICNAMYGVASVELLEGTDALEAWEGEESQDD